MRDSRGGAVLAWLALSAVGCPTSPEPTPSVASADASTEDAPPLRAPADLTTFAVGDLDHPLFGGQVRTNELILRLGALSCHSEDAGRSLDCEERDDMRIPRAQGTPVWTRSSSNALPADFDSREGAALFMDIDAEKRRIHAFMHSVSGMFVTANGQVLALVEGYLSQERRLFRIGADGSSTEITLPESARPRAAEAALVGPWLVWQTLRDGEEPVAFHVADASVGDALKEGEAVGRARSSSRYVDACVHPKGGYRVVFGGGGTHVLVQRGDTWELLHGGDAHLFVYDIDPDWHQQLSHLTCTEDGLTLAWADVRSLGREHPVLDVGLLACGQSCSRARNELLDLGTRKTHPAWAPVVTIGKKLLLMFAGDEGQGVSVTLAPFHAVRGAEVAQLVLPDGSGRVEELMGVEGGAVALVRLGKEKMTAVAIDDTGKVSAVPVRVGKK